MSDQFRIFSDFDVEEPEGERPFWLEACLAAVPDETLNDALGLPCTQGFVFCGPAGTGKTTTMYVLANELMLKGYEVYDFSGADVPEPTEGKEFLKELFSFEGDSEDGHRRKCLLFEYPEKNAEAAGLLNSFADGYLSALSEDRYCVAVILTQNPGLLPPELIKNMYICTFELPDAQAREAFIRKYIEDVFTFRQEASAEEKKQARANLVRATEGMSYSDLEKLRTLSLTLMKNKFMEKHLYNAEEVMAEWEQMDEKGERFEISEEEMNRIVYYIRIPDAPAETAAVRPAASLIPDLSAGMLSGEIMGGSMPSGESTEDLIRHMQEMNTGESISGHNGRPPVRDMLRRIREDQRLESWGD